MKTKLWLRLLLALALITIASAKRVKADDGCSDPTYNTQDGDECCTPDGSCCIQADGTPDPENDCLDGGTGSNPGSSGWGSSCKSNQTPSCCDSTMDCVEDDTSCDTNQSAYCCDTDDDYCTAMSGGGPKLYAQLNLQCSGNFSSCCCDPVNGCSLGESCSTGQTSCCCSNSGSGVSNCPGAMTYNWNPSNPCPPGQGKTTDGTGCKACDPGLTPVNGECVPDCINFPCQTGCPNPCACDPTQEQCQSNSPNCWDGTTPQCTSLTSASSGTGNSLLTGTGPAGSTYTCSNCQPPPSSPAPSCQVPPGTGSSPSGGQ